ncbi:MAG: polysaccharide deacetylase family protein [Tetrasphaera sp.]
MSRLRSRPALTAIGLLALAGVSVPAPAGATTLTCSSSTPVSQRPVIHAGDGGTCVALAERLLKQAFFYDGPTTGYWNGDAVDGMSRFQQSYRLLRRDGSVPTASWQVLEKVNAPFDQFKCGNASSNKVLLVFDDTPTSTTSYRALIDAARDGGYGIGVAPNGSVVRAGLADVAAARARGLLVVDHAYDHYDLTTLSSDKIRWEITQPDIGSNYLRPPYGSTNSTVLSIMAQQGKRNCLWDIDPRDWARSSLPLEVPDFRISPREAADYIIRNARGGSSVVVHMQHMGTNASLLRYIDLGLRDRGLSLCKKWGRATNANMPNAYCI